MNWLIFALMTVVSWGVYGAFLHTGQMVMKYAANGVYRAFLFVGLAYFCTDDGRVLGSLWCFFAYRPDGNEGRGQRTLQGFSVCGLGLFLDGGAGAAGNVGRPGCELGISQRRHGLVLGRGDCRSDWGFLRAAGLWSQRHACGGHVDCICRSANRERALLHLAASACRGSQRNQAAVFPGHCPGSAWW